MKWQIVPGAMVTPKEKQWLVDAAQKANKHDAVIVNIGILYGCSLWCFVESAPDAMVYGIDIDLKPMQYRNECKAVLIEGESAKTGQAFDHPIDLLFIDGAHDYEQVKRDIVAWSSKVKSGGVMAFHDYNYRPEDEKWDHTLPGVKKAVDEWYKANGANWRNLGLVDSLISFERI